METVRIFDIQHASYVDGPGVRTVVFFKGCNLNCAWCHNPESKAAEPQMLFYRNRCIGCGKCVQICPNHAILPTLEIDRELCGHCGKCADACPEDARSLCGRNAATDEIMKDLIRDRAYFTGSGGGVTFSGGECMLQIDGLAELLHRCRAENISAAVDTAGNVPWEYFERILPETDLFLYDVKHVDEDIHRKGTGVSNRQILANLERLLKLCPDRVIIRIPVIPGFNDDDHSLRQIGEWLGCRAKPQKIEMLPYHKLGEHKAQAVGAKPFIADAPTKEAFTRKKKVLFDRMEEEQ